MIDSEKTGLSAVVPVFNEVGAVRKTIEQLLQILSRIDRPTELIVVDDGSTDGSGEELSGFRERISIVRHETNRGYGAALKSGILRANYPLVAITDADGTYPHQDLPRLLAEMETSDMVVGARTGVRVAVPVLRRPAKWFLTKLANYLTENQIPDLNSGFRIFRKKVAKKYLHILSNRFSFTTTLTMAMLCDSYRVRYLPIDYHKREGRSKIKPIDLLAFLILIARTVTFFNPLRFFLPISLVLFVLGVGSLVYDVFWQFNLTDSTTLLFLFALQVGLIGILADLIVRKSDS